MVDALKIDAIFSSIFTSDEDWTFLAKNYYPDNRITCKNYEYKGFKFRYNLNTNRVKFNKSLNKTMKQIELDSSKFSHIVSAFNYYEQNFVTNILTAEINTIEFFWDIEVDRTPRDYIGCLIPESIADDFSVVNEGETLYIKHGAYEIKFYDKSKEAHLETNTLRFEIRVLKPMDFFNGRKRPLVRLNDTLTVGKLLEKEFFIEVQNIMWDMYDSIHKKHVLDVKDSFTRTMQPKEFIRTLTVLGIESAGGMEALKEYVSKFKGIMGGNVGIRILKMLYTILSNPNYMSMQKIHLEMDEKFKALRDRNIDSINTYYNNCNNRQILSLWHSLKDVIFNNKFYK